MHYFLSLFVTIKYITLYEKDVDVELPGREMYRRPGAYFFLINRMMSCLTLDMPLDMEVLRSTRTLSF